MLVRTEPGRDAVLVGVDPDRETPRFFRRLNNAKPCPAGHLVDDVGAGVEHRLGHLQSDRGIAEVVRIGDFDFRIRIDVSRALDVADNEFVDADRLRPADDANDRLAGHALDRRVRRDHRRQRAGQIRPFLLLEQDRGDIGAGPDLIEDHVVRAGIILGDSLKRIAVRIFEVDDEPESGIGGATQNVRRLRDNIFRFDRFALKLVLRERLLEARVGEIVIGLVAKTSLRDNQGDWLFSRRCGDRPKAQGEGRKRAEYLNSSHCLAPLPLRSACECC